MTLKNQGNDYIQRLKERDAFFESDEFNRLMHVFNDHATNKGAICQERLKYADVYNETYAFTADEFGKVCDALFAAREDDLRHVGQSAPVFELDYQGLTFGLSIGQGSSYDCKITPKI